MRSERLNHPAGKNDRVAGVPQAGAQDNEAGRLYGIGELAAELGISPRTVRFYEAKGLLRPRRVGVNRVYDRRDRARLMLILRGKRLGFSLQEVAEYLDLYDKDPRKLLQVRHLLAKVDDAIADLNRKREDIDATLAELATIREHCLECIKSKDP
jgi:DNA-binding transcriptional MerR regulator